MTRFIPAQLIVSALLLGAVQTSTAQCTPESSIDDDFESYAAGVGEALPDCWSSQGTPGPIIGARNTSGEAHSGTQYMSIYTFFTADADLYIISPELSTIDGAHGAEFYIKSSLTDATYEFGTMSDANDMNTFVSASSATNLGSSYNMVSTGAIPANTGHKYFAIHIVAPTIHSSIKIDDFKWSAAGNLSIATITTNELSFAPNPASDFLTISGNMQQGEHVRMVNTSGQVVLSQEVVAATESLTLNVSDIEAGVYFVAVGDLTHKIIIR